MASRRTSRERRSEASTCWAVASAIALRLRVRSAVSDESSRWRASAPFSNRFFDRSYSSFAFASDASACSSEAFATATAAVPHRPCRVELARVPAARTVWPAGHGSRCRPAPSSACPTSSGRPRRGSGPRGGPNRQRRVSSPAVTRHDRPRRCFDLTTFFDASSRPPILAVATGTGRARAADGGGDRESGEATYAWSGTPDVVSSAPKRLSWHGDATTSSSPRRASRRWRRRGCRPPAGPALSPGRGAGRVQRRGRRGATPRECESGGDVERAKDASFTQPLDALGRPATSRSAP